MAVKAECFWHKDRSAVGYCAFCGIPVCDECHKGAFCKQCVDEPPKSKSTALLLAVFLGWLGVHRYYMRFYITGVLYTLTFGLCGIGWALDVIRILFWSTISKKEQPYYVSDRVPYCTVGIKTEKSAGSLLGDLGGTVGDIMPEFSGYVKWWYDRRYWRDKLRRPLLRFGQKSLLQ